MSNDTLTKAEQLLLKEYELRAGQGLHEDKLRHQLVKFIITLSTAVIGGLVYILKEQYYCYSQLNYLLISADLLLVFIILISIIIIAKIRKAQLLSMKICDNIREYFYKTNYLYYNINIISKLIFPREESRISQTILFVYILSFFNSFLLFLIYPIITQDICLLVTILYIFLCFLLFIIQIYLFRYFARPDQIEPYSDSNPPF